MGLRGFFKRYLPATQVIREHRVLRILGARLTNPILFHITRRSAAGGMANGLFFAGLPLPGHTLLAAICAIYLRVNLPLSVVIVWLNNPITLAPYLYLAYKTGALLINVPEQPVNFELTFSWAREVLRDTWEPLIVGCLFYSVTTAAAGYALVKWLWRFVTIQKWEERKRAKQKKK